MQNLPVSENQLNQFIKEALKNCYLGEFKKAEIIQRPGFFEMEYTKGDLNYRDSFTGFYLSAGQEIIRHINMPIWSMSYRGGVVDEYLGDSEFFKNLESFLREALGANQIEEFSPRGPKEYVKGDFLYKSDWTGNIKEFSGVEEIHYKNKKAFYHNFFGGMIVGKDY
jgi:hypothetical protein